MAGDAAWCEGPTDDPSIQAVRRRQVNDLIVTGDWAFRVERICPSVSLWLALALVPHHALLSAFIAW